MMPWMLGAFGYWIVGCTVYFAFRLTKALDRDRDLQFFASIFWPLVAAFLIVFWPVMLVDHLLEREASDATGAKEQ